VARAKRTDRAEARRKYRAYLQAQEDAGIIEDGDSTDDAGQKPVRSRDQKVQASPQPGARMGMFAAAKAAYRTPHYMDDIRNVRSLVFRSNAIWPAAAVSVAAGAYLSVQINRGGSNDPIGPMLYQFLFYPVPLLPPMIAGFLAPRSTWLAGIITSFIATMTLVVIVWMFAGKFAATAGGLVVATSAPTTSGVPTATGSAAVTATVLVTASPVPSASAAPNASPSATSGTSGSSTGGLAVNNLSDALNLAGILLAQSLAFGAMMAAGTGWYKRFLSLTSGTNKKPAPRSSRGQSAQRRRPTTKR
jgi:hypothetical protein